MKKYFIYIVIIGLIVAFVLPYVMPNSTSSETPPFSFGFSENLAVSGLVSAGNLTTKNIIASENVAITGNLNVNGVIEGSLLRGFIDVPDNSIQANKLFNYPNCNH